MDQATLRKRRREFEDQCEHQKVNWKECVKGLQENDDRVILAALATLLKFNLRGAFDPSKSLVDLERESKSQQEMDKQIEDLSAKLGP